MCPSATGSGLGPDAPHRRATRQDHEACPSFMGAVASGRWSVGVVGGSRERGRRIIVLVQHLDDLGPDAPHRRATRQDHEACPIFYGSSCQWQMECRSGRQVP
ncbi:hypothetical protein CBR_g34787 [Chara braunii]|uniref:Uncharacterized protein n=1 Tax=Chara braunii TaxID=69332 RepID=A0A388LJJ0_CHABU|nr:hypothetical protein CBR_g34787 [Chara braunii]|eukprot:GBG82411.1 hypothetical protein CBR_g34787 [Chara braunii]